LLDEEEIRPYLDLFLENDSISTKLSTDSDDLIKFDDG
jgi:hypothetical protein